MEKLKSSTFKKLSIVLCVLITVSFVVGIIISVNQDEKSQLDIEYEQYEDISRDIKAISKEYVDLFGCVKRSNLNILLDEVCTYLDGELEKGVISKYTRGETGVSVEFKSGLTYLYSPHIQRSLSGNGKLRIVALNPCDNFFDNFESGRKQIAAKIDSIANSELGISNKLSVSDNIRFITDEMNTFSHDANDYIKNNNVTVQSIKNLGKYSVLIIEGHGVWYPDTDTCYIVTGEKASKKSKKHYKEQLDEKDIVITAGIFGTEDSYAISPKFLRDNLDMNENSLVFLGNCNSLKNDKLANAFIEKGAYAVIGYDDYVDIAYEKLTRSYFFRLITQKNEDGNYNTIEDTVKHIKKYFHNYLDDLDSKGEISIKLNNDTDGLRNILDTSKEIYFIEGTVKDKITKKPIENVLIEAIDNTNSNLEPIAKTVTDKNGNYKIKIQSNSYSLSFSHNDYEYYGTSMEIDDNINIKKTISLTRKTGTLKATVKDSTNGKIIPNVSVKVVDMLTENADEVATVKTDKNGVFSVKLPYGNYSLYFNHDNYRLDNDTNREDVIVSHKNNSLAEAILLTPKVPKLTNVIYRYDDIIDEYRIKCLKDKAHETYEVTRLCCCSWTLIDINNDGTDELVIETGTCEADRKYHVYTYKNEKIVKLDEFYAFHCSLYKYNGQILMYQWYMGDVDKSGPWELCSLNIKNGDLTVDNIKSGQPGEEPDERWFNSQIEFNDLFMTCDYEIDLPNKENDIRYILNTASGILSKWKHGSYKVGEGVLIYDEKIKSEFYYYRINYDGIDSVSDLRKYLKNYFDDNICDEIIKGEYMTHYVDYNGHLYCSEIDEPFGTFLMYQLDKIEIKEQVGNTATVSLEYLASNGYEIFVEENRQIEQKIKYVNGKWILADKCNLLY